MLRTIFYTILTLFLVSGSAWAQKAWVVPNLFNPDDEITIYVDVSKTDCKRLANTTDDLFLWMWLPAEPKIKNGDWTNSNEDLKLTQDANNPNIYSYTLIPSEFFDGISSADIYKENFHFLIKKKDGTGEGGGGCDEDKTEDLEIEANPVPGCNTLFCQFPQKFLKDDYFVFIYNNAKEEKATMQEGEVGEDNFYVYPRATLLDGSKVEVAAFNDVGDTPELQLIKDPEDGFYKLEFIPEVFFSLTEEQDIELIEFVVRKKVFNGPDDKTDEKNTIYVGCN